MTDRQTQMNLFLPPAEPPPRQPKPEKRDAEHGALARDLGIARVEAATEEWQEHAVATIRVLAGERSKLTTDDVWERLGRDAELEGRAMGAAMRTAAKLGYIRRTDRTTKSVRVACHRRDLRVWESLLEARCASSPTRSGR